MRRSLRPRDKSEQSKRGRSTNRDTSNRSRESSVTTREPSSSRESVDEHISLPVAAPLISSNPIILQPSNMTAPVVHNYSNWTIEHDLVSTQNFVPLLDLVRCLTVAHRIPFAIKARRDEARETLMGLLSVENPAFSKERRFPDQPLVNVSIGIIADLLDRVTSALDFGERYLADIANSQSTVKYGSTDDAKLSFYRGIQRLLDILVKTRSDSRILYGVFDRSSFEAKYSMRWV
ncbi:capsid protein [Abisko virus]|uniref:capsid protein n=1 Tax=Abisko virus TaxID=2025595 RepID=UPI000B99F5B9|nr:capsid protein [Abisko virus]AST13106.1 capsid protein [Abisko virus]